MTDVTPPVPPESSSAPLRPDGDDDRWMLSAYLDDELTADERLEVEARVETSAVWRAELAEVQTAREAVRGLDLRVAPDGFWEHVEAAVAAVPDPDPADGTVTRLDDHRDRRGSRRRIIGWAAGGVAAALVFGAMFVIPGRQQVRPNVAAVVTRHGATSADHGDPISGLVPLAPMRSSR